MVCLNNILAKWWWFDWENCNYISALGVCSHFAYYVFNFALLLIYFHAFSNSEYLFEGEAPPPGYVCRVCCIPGHFIWQCPTGSKPPPPGYIRYKCGVPGHFIHFCPNEIHVKSCSKKKILAQTMATGNMIPEELVHWSPLYIALMMSSQQNWPRTCLAV
jgi:hypothetical protein